jgi:hypothetical protein
MSPAEAAHGKEFLTQGGQSRLAGTGRVRAPFAASRKLLLRAQYGLSQWSGKTDHAAASLRSHDQGRLDAWPRPTRSTGAASRSTANRASWPDATRAHFPFAAGDFG